MINGVFSMKNRIKREFVLSVFIIDTVTIPTLPSRIRLGIVFEYSNKVNSGWNGYFMVK
jgi:hypothetical protein